MKIEDYEYLGLLFSCPMKKATHNCPFIKFRELRLREKIKLFTDLTETEVEELTVHHTICIKKRENSTIVKNK